MLLIEVNGAHALLLMRSSGIRGIFRRGDGWVVCLCASAGGESVADVLDCGGVEDVAVAPRGLR
jgi:hypothetical protein